MDVNTFEGLVKCKVLPLRRLHIPLLPSHINKKLMFVLCRKCAETENPSICNHSVGDRSLSGSWVYVEWKKNSAYWIYFVEGVRGMEILYNNTV